VLVSDSGVRGLVIRPRGGEIAQVDAGHVRADAAVTINGLVRWTINHGCAGLEAWAGTPGTVGGGIFGNAHFGGRLIGDLVTEVRLVDRNMEIRGEFELPPLAGLRYEDQVFVSEFVRCHGSIKYMEKAFGVSYPTVKNRLNRIVQQVHLVEVEQLSDKDEVFDLLERGQISVQEATERLKR